ncbi:hypothetical protein GCM10020295_68010 [Streptomyces cinereospinus]
MTTTLAGGRAARRQTMRRIRPRRSPAVPLLLAVWAGAGAVLGLWWQNTPSVADTTGRIVNAGRITGLLAGYLMALVVLQMARVPALERRVGSDRVARWHATTGRYTLCLVLAHVLLTMWGYALQAGKTLGDIVQQTVDSVGQLPDMGKAAIGTGLLVLIGLFSVGPVRRRMPYDTWYHVHLLTYAAVYLTFWHQIRAGNDFAVEPAAKTFWYGLYGAVTALVVWFRIITPVRLNLKHRLRVEAVIEETPGIVSVLIGGRKLHRMGAEAGAVLPVAVPGAGHAVQLPPVLAVGGAPPRHAADHREGDRRPQCPAARAGARHPGVGRGAVRRADRPAAQPRQGAAGGGRRRDHADAGAVRDAAGGRPVTSPCCTGPTAPRTSPCGASWRRSPTSGAPG